MRPRPYVTSRDPNFGTVEYVEMFFKNYRALREFMCGAPPPITSPLYLMKQRSNAKAYIGRAALISSGKNPYEKLWCAKTDIQSACLTLELHERLTLGRMYIAGDTELEIAARLQTTSYMVSHIHRTALEKIAAYLDGKHFYR